MSLFGGKLSFLMRECKITSARLARDVMVDPATISRWLTGKRVPLSTIEDAGTADPAAIIAFCTESGDTVVRLAEYFALKNRSPEKRAWLCKSTGIDEALESEAFVVALARWFTSDEPVYKEEYQMPDNAVGAVYMGFDGLRKTISMLSDATGKDGGGQIYVYVASEQSNMLLDDRMREIWERLYEISGKPLLLVMEQGIDYERIFGISKSLLPYMLAGIMEAYYIPSAEKIFCYNLAFLSEAAGIVLTIETPGGDPDTSLSVFASSNPFVGKLKGVLSQSGGNAKPIFRFLRAQSEVYARQNAFFETKGEIYSLFGLTNVLYADTEAFKNLLMENGESYEARRYYIKSFEKHKARFEECLRTERVYEICFLPEIQEMIRTGMAGLTELAFLEGTVRIPRAFIRSLLSGMVNALEKYENLDVMLLTTTEELEMWLDGDANGDVLKIKDNLYLLYQTQKEDRTLYAYSDNCPLVSALSRQFHTERQTAQGIRGRGNVISYLNDKLKMLEA